MLFFVYLFATGGPAATEMTPDMMVHIFKKFATTHGFEYSALVGLASDISDEDLLELEQAADLTVAEATSCICFKWFVASYVSTVNNNWFHNYAG
jgi:hypothetical protein